ncbi:hypothetical protein R3P38DRAFT_3236201 [Favolaschia claudopus]|uniref:Uncharacterized protein n=1 Tax=Favolaschia claudopus TaxID=2862362 RepID=A0AAV9ZD72_9AGAR
MLPPTSTSTSTDYASTPISFLGHEHRANCEHRMRILEANGKTMGRTEAAGDTRLADFRRAKGPGKLVTMQETHYNQLCETRKKGNPTSTTTSTHREPHAPTPILASFYPIYRSRQRYLTPSTESSTLQPHNRADPGNGKPRKGAPRRGRTHAVARYPKMSRAFSSPHHPLRDTSIPTPVPVLHFPYNPLSRFPLLSSPRLPTPPSLPTFLSSPLPTFIVLPALDRTHPQRRHPTQHVQGSKAKRLWDDNGAMRRRRRIAVKRCV